MLQAPAHSDDPLRLTAALTGAFALLCLIRLTTPSHMFFDEVHYVPAAKALLEGAAYPNREHPLLGKHFITLGIAIFGDNPFGWRIMPLLAGVIGFFALMRAMWFASQEKMATLFYGFLSATGFLLIVHSRIAMLDIFMIAALALAAWQFAAAFRRPERAHKHLLLTGVALGAAMASKWNAIPVAILPGLALLVAYITTNGAQFLTAKRAAPIPGVTLLQAFVWLGIVPLATYAVTFLPALWFENSLLAEKGLIGLHRDMLDMQTQVLQPHPYQSNWPDWLFNLRAIWYLYEMADGAQRGVLLIGNPLSMLLGLPALIWCGYSAFAQRNWAALGAVTGFAASLGLWLVAEKSVQFYYHYFLPSTFLLAALALALNELWKKDERGLVYVALVPIGLLFAFFYPILTAAELGGADSFLYWTWLEGWA